jgi:molybdopterin converting factor small subunit
MDLQTRKLQFIEAILSVGSEKIMDKLETLLKKERQKEDNSRVSIDQYNHELDEAITRLDSGDYISHENVKKESEKWLK